MLIKIFDINKTYVLSLLQTFFQSVNFKKIFFLFMYPLPDNLQTLCKQT